MNDSTANKVLDAYGKYLLSVFDHKQEDLNEMTFTAVGAVHRNSDKDDHKPRDVINYWSEYQHDISSKDPHPSTFLQYVIAGCFLAKKTPLIIQAVNHFMLWSGLPLEFSTKSKKHHLM